LAPSAEINLTDQQRRRTRELNQGLANTHAEIEKSFQRQPSSRTGASRFAR
jgi:hypothetical protein